MAVKPKKLLIVARKDGGVTCTPLLISPSVTNDNFLQEYVWSMNAQVKNG